MNVTDDHIMERLAHFQKLKEEIEYRMRLDELHVEIRKCIRSLSTAPTGVLEQAIADFRKMNETLSRKMPRKPTDVNISLSLSLEDATWPN